MRTLKTIRNNLPALLMAVLLTLSCQFRDVDTNPAELQVRLRIPDMAVTKAETGEVGPVSEEMALHSMHLWVFLHNAQTLIASKYLSESDIAATGLQGGIETFFTLDVPDETYKTRPNVDVYVVFNAAGAGLSLGTDWKTTTPATLDAFVLQGNYFGTESLTGEVPAAGLPMAGVMRDCQIGGSFPIYTIPTVTVTRAVSKLRFVFCQLADSNGAPVDNFAVTGVTLDGQIGAQEKLFTTNVFTPADGRYPTNLFDISGYSTLSKSWTSAAELPQTIALNQTPGDYLFKDGMTAQQYETTIENGVTAGRLTQWGLAYLRETDKILSGTITYTVGGGAPKTTTFTMTAEGDFARNHSWIIYGYFIGGKLYVQPKVIPWIAGQDRFAYNTQSSTKMEYERYVRYDKDKNPSTWTDTWMSVSYGYPENADIGLPLYSPRILIKSINAYTLRVQVDNDKFQLLITNEDKTSFSLAPERQWFEIPPSDQEQNTYFYVVPVDNVSWQEPASITRLFLTEIHGSGGVPPENVPFNHNLPGDEDHTSILIHKISASDYKTTVDTEPAPGTGYYWISN